VTEGLDDPTVLVVEDETSLRRAYVRVLSRDYTVESVGTGEAALEALSPAIDIILLDRRLPDVPGDEVVQSLQRANYDCYVAMVTAVDPDFDIIDMGIDDYLVKPLTTDEIRGAVEQLEALAAYDEAYRELSQKRVTRSVLRQERSNAELQDSERFQRLETEIEELEAALEAMAEECAGVERDLHEV